MYMVFIFTGGVGAACDSAAVHATGATKSHSQMRCCKSARPALEIVSEQQQQKKKGRWLLFLRFVHCYFVSLCGLVVLMRAVRQTVPSQVTVAPKHLSAAATAVGLDVCMGEKVSFQVTSLIKGSSACGAFVGGFLFRFEASKGLFPLIV